VLLQCGVHGLLVLLLLLLLTESRVLRSAALPLR
jgi:hypothetical protein